MSKIYCWAAPLLDCCETQSREHIISKALFDEKVSIRGFPWCKNEPITIGINSLVRKNLCAHHNSSLAPLDAEAKKLLQLIRWANGTSNRIKNGGKRPPLVQKRSLNGQIFERWLLKTAINILSQTSYNHGSTDAPVPSLDDINVCFGRQPWPYGRGMYLASRLGESFNTHNTFEFMPIVDSSRSACGWIIRFCGFRFYLSIREDPFTTGAGKLWGLNEDLNELGLSYHTQKIEFSHGDRVHSVIHFDWS